MSVFVWLTSLSIIIYRSIHVAANGIVSFFLWLSSSAVATGLEKVSFHSNSKETQHQRMLKLLHNCTHLTH